MSDLSSPSRRTFLGQSAAALALGTICPALVRRAEAGVPAGMLGTVRLRLGDHPELVPLTGSKYFQFPSASGGAAVLISIVHLSDDTFAAVDRLCTHEACAYVEIQPPTATQPNGYYECPCHGSRYSATGTVLRPPTTMALPRYSVTRNGDDLFVEVTNVNPTAVGDDARRPVAFALHPNAPNPFNPATTISFTLTRPAKVKLTVFTALGEVLATLADETRPAGTHRLTFDGSGLASGTYLYRLEADGRAETRTLTLVR